MNPKGSGNLDSDGSDGSGGDRGAAPSQAAGPLAEAADDLDLAVVPVSTKMRSDVDRFGAFMRQIRTGYLQVGVALMLATGLSGTLVALTGSFSDWYMHLAMYLVLTVFGLLYVRAHLRRFRILGVFWFVLFAGLLGGFSWILIDLVPARLDVLSNRLRPDGLIGPEVGLRPEAPLLWLPVVLLWAQILWLIVHQALVAPAARRAALSARESGGQA